MSKDPQKLADSGKVHALLSTLFKDIEKSPVAFRPARVVFNYMRRNLKETKIPFEVVKRFEETHVRENQINKQVQTRKFPRLKYMAYGGLNDIWCLDLVDLHANRRIRGAFAFALTKMDLFSRQADAELITAKSALKVTEAFDKICQRHRGNLPRRVQTDEGKEFFNRSFSDYCKRNGIHHYKVNSEMKVAPIEAFNRPFQTTMYRYAKSRPKMKLREIVKLVIKNYNESEHSALFGLAPIDVDLDVGASLLQKILASRHRLASGKYLQMQKPFRFSLGDKVRTLSERGAFSKGYRGTYTEEVFVVARRFRRKHSPHINLYELRDQNNPSNAIEGIYYEKELQKTSVPKTVQKVYRKDKRSGKKLVSLLDHPKEYREWTSA